jgi:signal transduction histidine kinase
MGNMLLRLLGKAFELRCEFASAPAVVHGDANQIEQILLNLVVNARDAMPNGGAIAIGVWPREVAAAVAARRGPPWRAGAFVCLSVTDVGTGIPPEILPRLFEPFFTTKAKGQGTGLGLSTVYGIVQQHGGWVDVDSQLGRGSTFTVYLPVPAPGGSP